MCVSVFLPLKARKHFLRLQFKMKSQRKNPSLSQSQPMETGEPVGVCIACVLPCEMCTVPETGIHFRVCLSASVWLSVLESLC